jgi:hypothetical protein
MTRWWREGANTLLALGALLLLAGWFMPSLWRPAWADWRPTAWLLVAAGALIRWWLARLSDEDMRQAALAALTHSSLTPYEFAPVTLPMEEAAPLAASPPVSADEAAPRMPVDVPLAEPAGVASPAWTPALLRSLDAPRFTALCDLMLQQDGYVTRLEAAGADSGADIHLFSRLDLQQAVRIVACRPAQTAPVPAAALREFLGAVIDAGLNSGAFMTAGSFTAEAQALARRHGLTLIEGPDMLALIARRSTDLQEALMRRAQEGPSA